MASELPFALSLPQNSSGSMSPATLQSMSMRGEGILGLGLTGCREAESDTRSCIRSLETSAGAERIAA